MDKTAVAVLFGGRSSEHSISSATAGGVLRAIDRERYRVIPVDALAISRRAGLGRIVNSALLGVFARAVGAPSLATLERTLAERSPKLTDENLAARREGWRVVDASLKTLEAAA